MKFAWVPNITLDRNWLVFDMFSSKPFLYYTYYELTTDWWDTLTSLSNVWPYTFAIVSKRTLCANTLVEAWLRSAIIYFGSISMNERELCFADRTHSNLIVHIDLLCVRSYRHRLFYFHLQLLRMYHHSNNTTDYRMLDKKRNNFLKTQKNQIPMAVLHCLSV